MGGRGFASFVAPDLPEMVPGGYPDWILLARRAFISDRQNSTAAHGETSDGTPVQVSLFAADPPGVSHLRVHCPGKEDLLSDSPTVVFSRDNLILFVISWRPPALFSPSVSNCFIYRAADSNNTTSLVRIQDPNPTATNVGLWNTGIVRCGGDNHFAVAALSLKDYKANAFELSVFSSRTAAWTTRVVPLEPSSEPRKFLTFYSSKVIPLKGSFLGWVDLRSGILLCDVLSADPKVHYIPLPEPVPSNEDEFEEGETQFYRDVIGCGDLIRFVEMDYQYDGPEPADDSIYVPDDRWMAVTRSRVFDSGEWGRAHEVSSEDIAVSEKFHGLSDVPDELCEDGKPSLKKMPIAMPTLCECNRILYLMCKLRYSDDNGWVLAVNTGSNKLEAVAKYYAISIPGFASTFYPSLFSKYLNGSSTENQARHMQRLIHFQTLRKRSRRLKRGGLRRHGGATPLWEPEDMVECCFLKKKAQRSRMEVQVRNVDVRLGFRTSFF